MAEIWITNWRLSINAYLAWVNNVTVKCRNLLYLRIVHSIMWVNFIIFQILRQFLGMRWAGSTASPSHGNPYHRTVYRVSVRDLICSTILSTTNLTFLCGLVKGVSDDTAPSTEWFAAVGAVLSTSSTRLASDTLSIETVFASPCSPILILWNWTDVTLKGPLFFGRLFFNIFSARSAAFDVYLTVTSRKTKSPGLYTCAIETDLSKLFCTVLATSSHSSPFLFSVLFRGFSETFVSTKVSVLFCLHCSE